MKNRNIQIEYSRDGKPVLKVDNIYLHSRFYPEREAEKYVESNRNLFENRDTVLVYGLALGYHIIQLLKKVSSRCRIFVFDVDMEIYNVGSRLGCYDTISKDSRVKLCIGIDSLKDMSCIYNVDNIMIYNLSLKVLPEKYDRVGFMFKNFIMARQGIEKSKDIMKANYVHNLRENASSMKKFFEKYNFKGNPVVMAAAGPSLDYEVDSLKKLNGKVKIFCVGSALRTLVKNGIMPDMVCIIDCQEIVYNQLKGCEDLNVPLCFLSTASRWAVSKHKGPKYIFYNDETQTTDIIINTAKTVSVPTIDIAVKAGAGEILLLGQDLAFLDNRTHTFSYSEIYGVKDEVQNESKIYKKVQGVNGEYLNTRSEYLNFKYSIEKEIEDNPRVKFINCSRGAIIIGARHMELSEWISKNF